MGVDDCQEFEPRTTRARQRYPCRPCAEIGRQMGTDGKYLVTGVSVDTAANMVLKLAFENNTAGTNLSLCAGFPVGDPAFVPVIRGSVT